MSLDVNLTIPPTEALAVYDSNITHNLTAMAEAAGVYSHLWCADEIGITKAWQLIEPLKKAIASMRADPERFKKFDAPNGWGTYEHFVPWLEQYAAACEKYPHADVSISK